MVKRAISLELNISISAEDANKKSINGVLNNAKAFICSDTECRIGLTCTNWGVKNPNRIYFTPSSKENLHIAGCNESGQDEEKQRSKYEKENAKYSTSKNELIILRKILDQTTVKQNIQSSDNLENNKKSRNKSITNINSNSTKNEGSHVTSILTLLDMFQDSSFNNQKRFLKISSTETLSLDDFFIDLDTVNFIPTNQIRIYYGKVKVETIKDSLLKISFCNSTSFPSIFTSKAQMFKVVYGKNAKKYVDKDKELYVFFRGYLNDENKWIPFNDKFYKDLYFSLKNI